MVGQDCLATVLLAVVAQAVAAQDTAPMEARICRWYGGRTAAISLRFDDSHPTHIEKAVPMLDERGLTGTFLINPGNAAYERNRAAWEKTVIEHGHELGNHTMHHRGAKTDAEAEAEIGGCSEHLWALEPEKSRLRLFQRGGGTAWTQRKPNEYFLARYDLIEPVGGSLSCSEAYSWFTPEALEERLVAAIGRGQWLQTHFHGIDAGHLYITTPVFQRVLDLVAARSDELWNAGMSAIHKYQEERRRATLLTSADGPDRLLLHLACGTKPELYDQPLTFEIVLPDGLEVGGLTVADGRGEKLATKAVEENGRLRVRFDVAPIDQTLVVNGVGVGKAYLAAHGPDLVAPGPHPYLLFDAASLPALREKTGARYASERWERVKGEADKLVAAAPRAIEGEVTFEHARRAAYRASILAFAHALTEEASYAERAIPEIEIVLRASAWVHSKHGGEADLVSAEVTCGLALCYDWMHEAMGHDLRRQVKDAIVRRGLEPIFEATDAGVWWTVWPRCNWGAVIYGQAGVAAVAVLTDEPRAAEWVRVCRQKIWKYLDVIGEDGGWGEGVSYACYCWRNATLFMDALNRLTAGGDNLFSHPNPRRLPTFFAHLLLPDESGFVPFSNCGGGRLGGEFLWRLASAYDDPQAQYLADKMVSWSGLAQAFAFLWCDPELEAAPPGGESTCQHFRGIDWAVLRRRWGDPEATLLAFKGGNQEWDHHHHDHNSFALYARGRPLLIELGYPHEIWGCETEAHNTIMVNGRDQAGQVRVAGRRGDPRHRTEIGDFLETPWYTHLTGDATMAYEPDDVRSFVREVVYLRPANDQPEPDYFVMFDDVTATAPLRMDWIAHTYGVLAIEGRTVSVTQDDAAVDIVVVEPAAFEHEVLKKTFEEAGVSKPFETALADTFVKIRPTEPVERGRFLTVLAPRAAGDPPAVGVTAVRRDNVIGARVSYGELTDDALFALEAPEIDAEGVLCNGRSCVVRRVGERVVAAAFSQGRSLAVDGRTLLETTGSGLAAVAYGKDAVELRFDIYDGRGLAVHLPSKPARVFVNGRETTLEYDVERQTVVVSARRAGSARFELR